MNYENMNIFVAKHEFWNMKIFVCNTWIGKYLLHYITYEKN